MEEAKPMGTFYEMRDVIRNVCTGFEQVSVIDGLELAPHIPEFFGDRKIHPSGEGFLYLAMNLLKRFQAEG